MLRSPTDDLRLGIIRRDWDKPPEPERKRKRRGPAPRGGEPVPPLPTDGIELDIQKIMAAVKAERRRGL